MKWAKKMPCLTSKGLFDIPEASYLSNHFCIICVFNCLWVAQSAHTGFLILRMHNSGRRLWWRNLYVYKNVNKKISKKDIPEAELPACPRSLATFFSRVMHPYLAVLGSSWALRLQPWWPSWWVCPSCRPRPRIDGRGSAGGQVPCPRLSPRTSPQCRRGPGTNTLIKYK